MDKTTVFVVVFFNRQGSKAQSVLGLDWDGSYLIGTGEEGPDLAADGLELPHFCPTGGARTCAGIQ